MTKEEKAKIESRLQKYNIIQAEIDAAEMLAKIFRGNTHGPHCRVEDAMLYIKDRTIFEEFAKILDGYVVSLTAEADDV